MGAHLILQVPTTSSLSSSSAELMLILPIPTLTSISTPITIPTLISTSIVISMTTPTQTPISTRTAMQASSSFRSPTFHEVLVGRYGEFRFTPDILFAAVGDTVSFRFFATNHSVIRGENAASPVCDYACNPCVPYESLHPAETGFHSGNIKTQDNKGIAAFNFTVNDTTPIYVYCGATGSCYRNGMVAAINPPGNFSISNQRQAAVSQQFQLLPGEPWPGESDGMAVDANRNGNEEIRDKLSGGIIAGIVIATLSLVLLAAIAYLLFYRRKRDLSDQKEVSRSRNHKIQSTVPGTESERLRGFDNTAAVIVSPCDNDHDEGGLWSPVSEPRNENFGLSLDDKPRVPPPGHPAFGTFSNVPFELPTE